MSSFTTFIYKPFRISLSFFRLYNFFAVVTKPLPTLI